MSTIGQCEIRGTVRAEYEDILSAEALGFLAELTRRFRPVIDQLLDERKGRQKRLDSGELFDFLPETTAIRDADWRVAPLPDDLLDRRVELTGPVDRKMIINGLNSGANCFMADFEDATSPTWDNLLQGQKNLRDAVSGVMVHEDPVSGKTYSLDYDPAVLFVRTRGLHLPEAHVLVDGEPVPGALFDFGLFFFHNAAALLEKGSGPYFYLPKLETHREARLWNDIFVQAQNRLGLPVGSIKATVLIETLPAAFEMDEILYELRDHSAGLNCGRWDYIFSFAKKLHRHPAAILPDRQQVTMTQPFMRAYTQRVIQCCHRRGVHAMGGMAPQIPIRNDPEANRVAFDKVRADKLREVTDGHDGTWVAHPGLIGIAREVFDEHMPDRHQIDRRRDDLQVTADDLLEAPVGSRTEEGLRNNIRVGIRYLAAWLGGTAAVPIDGLMEDAATAEICRMQVWSWLRHEAAVGDRPLTPERFESTMDEEVERISALSESEANSPLAQAQALFSRLCLGETCEAFFTDIAYPKLIES